MHSAARSRSMHVGAAVLLAVSMQGFSPTTAAAMLAPTSGLLGGLGSHVLNLSGQVTATSNTDTGSNPALTLPDSYTYGNSLPSLTIPVVTTSSGATYEFYDAYVFTLDSAVASSVTTTINLGTMLGINNVQERLYSANPGDQVPYTGNGRPPFAVTYFQGWTSPIGGVGEVAVLNSVPLAAGTYVLEIRGNVTGTAGGSYAGVLNVVPAVPLPAGLPLLVSGLGALAGFVRRRALQRA